MNVLIESANNDYVKEIFGPLIETEGIELYYKEDHIGFGIDTNAIVVGMIYFIESSIISGITWDMIKYTIQKIIDMVSPSQVAKTNVYIQMQNSRNRYKIEVTNLSGKIHIELPEGIKIKSDE